MSTSKPPTEIFLQDPWLTTIQPDSWFLQPNRSMPRNRKINTQPQDFFKMLYFLSNHTYQESTIFAKRLLIHFFGKMDMPSQPCEAITVRRKSPIVHSPVNVTVNGLDIVVLVRQSKELRR